MMRLVNNDSENSKHISNESAKAESYWQKLAAAEMGSTQVYHEIGEKNVVDSDPLAQLFANIETLADLQGRLSFVAREVKYLIKA